MPAYVVVEVTVTDPERYAAYVKAGTPLVAQHGGRFVVRGGPVEGLEGAWSPQRLVVLEFPDRAAARRWYHSPEYTAARKLREGAAVWRGVLVEGVA